jgi:hypothetical protein
MRLYKLRISLLSLICLALSFITCNDSDNIVQEEQINDVMTTMSDLMARYDANGNADESQNSSGNMAIDFCFEFVFPIDFEMSNNTINTVNSLDELVDLLIESNDNPYIMDIIYPFDILVFNDETDTIDIMTIQNEETFGSLLDDCEFDLDEDNICYEIYDPVCVEITNSYGETIVLVYPNDCYAGLDGFSENDFLEDCDINGGYDDGLFENDCFDLVYPIVLLNSNGDAITINSEEALLEYIENWYSENCNNLDECEFDFELEFPVTVEYYSENNQQIQTLVINSEEELDGYVEEYCDTDGEYEDDLFENDCFDLVYPIVLLNSNGDAITINSEEALLEYIENWYSENCNNLDECEFDFELEFPVTVEYYSENNQQTQTLVINSEEELDGYIEEYCN